MKALTVPNAIGQMVADGLARARVSDLAIEGPDSVFHLTGIPICTFTSKVPFVELLHLASTPQRPILHPLARRRLANMLSSHARSGKQFATTLLEDWGMPAFLWTVQV